MALFQGLSAFPITPADERGAIVEPDLRRLIRRLVTAEVDSIGLLGSTGAYMYLTRDQRRRAVEIAVSEAGGRIPIMVGVGALRTDDAVRCAEDAAKAGADAVLLAPVSYWLLNEDEVFAHFVTVAQATDLPLCIYNNPRTTNFTFSAELIARLSRVTNVAAAKNPAFAGLASSDVQALRTQVAEGFSLGYSTDWRAAGALIAGGDAWYSVLGGLFPELCVPIVRAAQAGDAGKTQRLSDDLEPIWDLFNAYTSLRVIYEAAHLLALTDKRPPLPIAPLDRSERDAVRAALKRLDLLQS